jgi:hypothetical protein
MLSKSATPSRRTLRLLAPLVLLISSAWVAFGDKKDTPSPEKIGWIEPIQRNIEGWTVHVDPTLLENGKHADEGKKALKMLANHLQRITILLPAEPLGKMKKMEIWIEHQHPELSAMQYHPGAAWLEGRGYDPRLAKKVHITRAADLSSRDQLLKHPAVILHELAHAYHDQILSFDDKKIIAAYDSAIEEGILRRSHRGLPLPQRLLPLRRRRTPRPRSQSLQGHERSLGTSRREVALPQNTLSPKIHQDVHLLAKP